MENSRADDRSENSPKEGAGVGGEETLATPQSTEAVSDGKASPGSGDSGSFSPGALPYGSDVGFGLRARPGGEASVMATLKARDG